MQLRRLQAHFCAHELLDGSAPHYSIGYVARLENSRSLDATRLGLAFDRVVADNEVLHLRIERTAGGVAQILAAPEEGLLEIIDFGAAAAKDAGASPRERANHWIAANFPLRRELDGRLARIALLRLGPDEHLLFFAAHHALLDEAGFVQLLAQVERTYLEPKSRGDPSTAYTEYLMSRLADEANEDHSQHGPAMDLIPLFGHDGARSSPRSIYRERRMGVERVAALRRVAVRCLGAAGRIEMGNVALAAFAAWLHRASNAPRIAIGMPLHGRKSATEKEIVGLLMRPTLVRIEVDPSDSFEHLVARVHTAAREAVHAHGEADVRTADAWFNLHPALPRSFAGFPMRIRWLPRRSEPALVHLRLRDLENERAAAGIEIREDVVGERLATTALPQWLRVLDAVLEDPSRTPQSLVLESAKERAKRVALGDGPLPAHEFRLDENLTARVLEHAGDESRARAVALREGNRIVRYGELAGLVTSAANELARLGVALGGVVAIELERSIDCVVMTLSTLLRGGVVSYVDPSLPQGRRSEIVTTSRPAVHVDANGARRLPDARALVVADPAAFVVHTSGSTGRPRASVLSHRALLCRHGFVARVMPFMSGDVCAWKTPLAFVDSIAELLDPLLEGREIVIVRDAVSRDLDALISALELATVTRLTAVPSLLRQMLRLERRFHERLGRLRILISSGEELSARLALDLREALPRAHIFNVWGSSEVTADATCFEVDALVDATERVPIGRPIDGAAVQIVDACGEAVPLGAIGEIAVSGECVALGELSEREASGVSTAGFQQLPAFAHLDSPRAFRTGDRGRLRDDGAIEFLGRGDRRVKIRGVRVEPAQVEQALESHPSIAAASVVASDGVLRAVVVATLPSTNACDSLALRNFLRSRLPAECIPREIVFVDALPRLTSGKIDHVALAAALLPSRRATADDAVGPGADPLANEIATIFREHLRTAVIGLDSDFFECGGDSLLAVDVALAIESRTHLRVPIAAIAANPTPRGLAIAVRTARVDRATIVTLRTREAAQSRPGSTGLFLVPPAGSTESCFVPLARRLDSTVIAFSPLGAEPGELPETSIEATAARYVAALDSVQPRGPYRMGGRCFGGIVAFEIVRQLEARGDDVELLVMLDVLRPPGHARIAAERVPDSEIANPRKSARESHRLRVVRAQLEARQRYFGGPVAAHALFVTGGDSPILRGLRRAWPSLLRGGIDVVHVPGGHRDLMREPRVATLAARIQEALDRLDSIAKDRPAQA